MLENNSFKRGIKNGIPICLGYLSVSFAFGIFGVGSGLTVLQTLLISMTNLTSAGQLAGVPIITAGGSLAELAMSQLIINLRYSLMSVSLSQKLSPGVKFYQRFLIAFGNTDEVFAVAAGNYGTVGTKYMMGLITMPYIGWATGTFLGAVAGNVLPKIVVSALGVAIYGMFIAIIVPASKHSKSTAACVLFSLILGCLFAYVPGLDKIPGGFVIIICAVVASALFAIIAPIKDETEDKGNE